MQIKTTDIRFSLQGVFNDIHQPDKARRQQDIKENIAPTQNVSERSDDKKVAEVEVIQSPKTKAIFAVDENKNVVIRIIDEEGNVIRQIPPEEFTKMVKVLKENIKNILNLEA